MPDSLEQPPSAGPASAWLPDDAALATATTVYEEVLSLIEIQGLAVGIPHGAGVAMHEGEGYANALIDLSRLLEEVRFEASVAALYAAGVRDALREVRERNDTPSLQAGFANKARAILAGFIATGVPPANLIHDPTLGMGGMRVLGGWWAAQLYDSSMMRGVAALDRLVALLFYVEGLEVNPDWTPAFRRRTMEKLRTWTNDPEWSELLALLDHELFVMAKGYRDGLVHRSRYAAELHGDFVIGRFDAEGHLVEKGFGGDIHFAIVASFYNEVLRVAVGLVTTLVSRAMESRGAQVPKG